MTPWFKPDGEVFKIEGRGTVFTGTLLVDHTRGALSQHIGEEIEMDGKKFVVKGVESFCVDRHPAGRGIGLLLEERR